MRHLAIVSLVLVAVSCGRRTIRDELTRPVAIASVKPDQIVLADGSTLDVEHVSDLLAAFPSISAVEVKPDGTLWCLIELDHSCGNDPVGTHVEKVPLVGLIAELRRQTGTVGMRTITSRRKLDLGVFYGVVDSCGGTWDRNAGASFAGE